jgi:diguanylate cyclase (GGDEF)-like protein/PAS domain S-box-containing protein
MSKRLTYEELEQRVRELEARKTPRERSDIDGLIESIQAGVVVHGADGNVIKSNKLAQIVLGLTYEQMSGKGLVDPAWSFLREDGSPMPVEEYPVSRVIATKTTVHNLMVGIRRRDKTEPIWVLNTAVPEFDAQGQITQIVTSFMDVSALKNSEERYRNLFENTHQEVHLWKLVRDEHGAIRTWRLVEVNTTALQAWGKTRSDVIGETVNEIFSFDATEQFKPIVKKVFSEGAPYTWETYFPPTGQYLYMTSAPFGEYFISSGSDITDYKQTENALKESEERHRLFNNPSFGGSIIHDKGLILDCSSGITNISGYSYNELIGMNGLLLITPDCRDFARDKIASGCEEPYEAESIRKDGTIFPCRIHAKAIHYHGKQVRVVEFRDISEIKRKEEALKESEERLRTFVDTSPYPIVVTDAEDEKILHWSKSAQDMFGHRPKTASEWFSLAYPDPHYRQEVIDRCKPYLDRALYSKTSVNTGEYQITCRDGSVKICEIYAQYISDQLVLTNNDITERKQAESKLIASEQKYRNIAENLPGMILRYQLHKDGSDQLLYVSKGIEDLYEVTQEDAVKDNTLLWDRVHPDDLDAFVSSVKESAQNLSFWKFEHRVRLPDERNKWVHMSGTPIKQDDGSIIWDSIGLDVTEQKHAATELKNSERLLRNIIDSSTDYIFAKDKNLKTILCNKAFAQAVNKQPPDLIGKTDIENGWDTKLVKGNPEKGIKGYEEDDLDALNGKVVQNTDTAIISGKSLYFDSVKIPLADQNNEIFGVLGISRDITDKENAQQALEASEEQFRTLVNTSPYPIVVTDAEDEKILHWSKSAQDMFGHRPKMVSEWLFLAYPDPHYRQEVSDRWKRYLDRAHHSKTSVNTGQYQITCRDGSVKICEIYAQFVINCLVVTFSNISELKRAENKLREMVEIDFLTRVYSRQHLLGLAERMFLRIKQDRSSLSCMMFDIDHFKSINDNYGHKAGDAALTAFSKIVSNNFRSNDLFGRVGGEEFVAVVPDMTLEAGKKLAEKIRVEVEKTPIRTGADRITMTVSIGISMCDSNNDLATFGELMELADKALYAAKNSGRNRVCIDS